MKTIHKHVDAASASPVARPRVLEVQLLPAANTPDGTDLIRLRIDAPGERASSITMTAADWTTMQQVVEDALAAPE